MVRPVLLHTPCDSPHALGGHYPMNIRLSTNIIPTLTQDSDISFAIHISIPISRCDVHNIWLFIFSMFQIGSPLADLSGSLVSRPLLATHGAPKLGPICFSDESKCSTRPTNRISGYPPMSLLSLSCTAPFELVTTLVSNYSYHPTLPIFPFNCAT